MSRENNSKIVCKTFDYYDKDGIREFLEQKAAEGWRLVRKLFAGEWEFERTEPKHLHYAITYLPRFSNEDEFLTSENKFYFLRKSGKQSRLCCQIEGGDPPDAPSAVNSFFVFLTVNFT